MAFHSTENGPFSFAKFLSSSDALPGDVDLVLDLRDVRLQSALVASMRGTSSSHKKRNCWSGVRDEAKSMNRVGGSMGWWFSNSIAVIWLG